MSDLSLHQFEMGRKARAPKVDRQLQGGPEMRVVSLDGLAVCVFSAEMWLAAQATFYTHIREALFFPLVFYTNNHANSKPSIGGAQK